MVSATAVLFAAITGGFASTYLYDPRAPLLTRWAAGTATGLAALSLTGFLAASLLGLGWPAVLVAAALSFAPAATFVVRAHRERLRADLSHGIAAIRARGRRPRAVAGAVVGIAAMAILWSIMDRAMIVRPTGAIFTGDVHNFGDLPFHLTVVSRFVANNNLPPEHPSFAGVPFTYPFLTDLLSALLVTIGADLRTAIVLPALLGVFAFVLLLHRWTLDLTNDALAACVAPILMLVGGGLGWWVFLQEAWQAPGNVGSLLSRLPHDYTIRETGLRFGNVITTLLIPQRGINLALPLAVVIFRQWWLADRDVAGTPKLSVRRMLAAGGVAGLLPLTHGHTYIVVVGMAGCLALLFRMWPAWIVFFVVAAGLGVPQLLWLAKGSAVASSSFVGWQFGWDRGATSPAVFWLMNTGALIPIIVWALVARGERSGVTARLRRFYLPFLLCFVVPNVVRLAPWIWDNIKVLAYWFLASTPIVSLVLARGYRAGSWRRVLAVVLLVSLTAAGTLDLWRVLSRATEHEVLTQPAVEFASLIASTAEGDATVLHAPIHNHSVALSGRRSFMGYPGHLGSQGLDFAVREREIRQMYAGGPDATRLFARHRIDYVVVGADERRFSDVNDAFFASYPIVARHGPYLLYRVTQRLE